MKKSNTYMFMLLLVTASCGLPLNQLTPEERVADMEWAFTIFKHNYAPAELKNENFGVQLSELENGCVELAEEDMDNQSFLALFQRCIRSFKDAHVGAQQMNNGLLPEYATVAHLGFLTMRTKWVGGSGSQEALRIVQALKGSDNSGAPLLPGDLILSVNNRSLEDYLTSEIVPYVDVGQRETNLSLAALRFGVRTSIDMALPEDDEVLLTVVRGSQRFDILIPWIVEDMLEFQLKQKPEEEEAQPKPGEERQIERDGIFVTMANSLANSFFGYEELQSLFSGIINPAEFVTQRLQSIFQTSFRRMQFNPTLRALMQTPWGEAGADWGLVGRQFPYATRIDDLMSEPEFTAKVVTIDEQRSYAYVKIDGFPAEDKILTEWHRALTAVEDKAIPALIIDMIDNEGGSLVHGMRMLNMLRQGSINFPSLQFKLNNNWMIAFKTQAAFGTDDYSKSIARRVVRELEEDQDAGLSISRPISVRMMDPFFLQNPSFGLPGEIKIVLLVNEFCVSMCDIFSSVFQDNEMGTVIGQKTMGGGGNVVQHGLSPVSKMGLALTESLVVTPRGAYLENNGVEPDIAVDMVKDREGGFAQALLEAVDVFFPGINAEPQLPPGAAENNWPLGLDVSSYRQTQD